jgi:hypothetical protein
MPRPAVRWRAGVLGGVMGLLWGCSAPEGISRAQSTPSRPVAAGSVGSVGGRGRVKSERDADLVISEALVAVSRVRGLPARGSVRGRLLSREEMLEVVRTQIAAEVPPSVVEAQARLLLGLGLVPPDFDYMASVLLLMAEQLAGMYEPKSKVMLLSEDLGETERWATLAHELVHALQDQHFDLGRRMAHRAGDGDQQSATQTLAEGDATSAMLDLLRGRPASELDDRVLSWELRGLVELGGTSGVPGVLRRALVAPYVDGVLLVSRLRRQGGWAAVDELWRNPATSTEQLLHPEKLVRREAPVKLAAPEAPAGSGWQLMDSDVLGEQGVRLVLEEWLPRGTAVESAADWGGDQMAVYRRDDEYAGVWHVFYDSRSAAERGLLAFARGLLRGDGMMGGGNAATDSNGWVPVATARKAIERGYVCRERPVEGPFAVLGRERSVVLTVGPYRLSRGRAVGSGDCLGAVDWATRVAKWRTSEAPVPHPRHE